MHGHVQEAAQVARVQRAGQEAAAQKVREDSCSPAKKMEQKPLLVWEWPCLVAFVVKIVEYWEAFPKIALRSQVKVTGRVRVGT